ncbi:NADH dehydrogenase 1 beta subcomplex subunit 3 [Ephemerocybe angulata]|uniref:NADH dehydrogenase 1 beta subcomplex subunit 3 n=1 Tax=Ephemerocybe angulata TaxID=980116 RepID=A0A8H6MG08_9AGAR|nr:NADH dehydrogenase 1 beta subcomplex subunit 3 [Tulosesus angulatus]
MSQNPLPLYRDPWAKREAFRKSPIFSNRVMFRNLFPGFGIAVVAFTAYVAVDNFVLSKQEGAHGHGASHH